MEGNYLQSYARYRGNTAILVIPNNQGEDMTFTVRSKLADMGLDGGSEYVVTDLDDGKELAAGGPAAAEELSVFIRQDTVKAIRIEKKGGDPVSSGSSGVTGGEAGFPTLALVICLCVVVCAAAGTAVAVAAVRRRRR